MKIGRKGKFAIGGTITAIIVSGMIALIVYILDQSMTCKSEFSKWEVTRSLAPTLSGYTYKLSSPNSSIEIPFIRNSLFSFTIGSVLSKYPEITFTKPSSTALFWPTWTFSYNGTTGTMEYMLVNPINRYLIDLNGFIKWRTDQILPKSIPNSIDIRDTETDSIIAEMNTQPSLTKSIKICILDNIKSPLEQVVMMAIAVSYDIK